MAVPSLPLSTSTSPYRRFERRPIPFAVVDHDIYALVLENGVKIFESDEGDLMHAIIERNDTATLNRYLEKFPGTLVPRDTYNEEAFYIAARDGRTDVLRVLLEHYAAHPTQIEGPNARGYLLLNVACRHAQIGTARFLLDNQPALGEIQARDDGGGTALLMAAYSLACAENDRHDSILEYVARGEQLMQLLLDKGADARDIIPSGPRDPPKDGQPFKTVLGLAISRASPKLVKRLINQGADVHAKQSLYIFHGLLGQLDRVWDVTPLHVGSFHLNTEGIQVLFDHRDSSIDIADMVLCRDTNGRIPLHLAAGSEEHMLPQDDIISHAISTTELLLASNPSTVNFQDNQGHTALHYAVITYAKMLGKYFDVLKILCANGADASLRGKNGKTPLHCIDFNVLAGRPDITAAIDLLLAHGASVDDTDMDGNTPLHLMAKNLQHVEVARALLRRGASISTQNSKGNTPLHEAADGFIYSTGRILTPEYRISAQNDMIRVLQEAAGNTNLMDQPNIAGKTPRQIRDETRNKWLEEEKSRNEWMTGKGRGRGRGRPVS
jgi:ankyrin repeat protein